MASKGRRTARQRANGAEMLAEEAAHAVQPGDREGRNLYRQAAVMGGAGVQVIRKGDLRKPVPSNVGCTVASLDYLDSRAKHASKGSTGSMRATSTGGRRLLSS